MFKFYQQKAMKFSQDFISKKFIIRRYQFITNHLLIQHRQ